MNDQRKEPSLVFRSPPKTCNLIDWCASKLKNIFLLDQQSALEQDYDKKNISESTMFPVSNWSIDGDYSANRYGCSFKKLLS